MIEFTEKEKADSVMAYAHFLETGSVEGIEFSYNATGRWLPKTYRQFSNGEKYRLKPEPTPEDYLAGHKASGLKVGDRVRVLRTWEDCEGGSHVISLESDVDLVGRIFIIEEDLKVEGFGVRDESGGDANAFPYFVLEKVEPEYRPFKNSREFIESGIEWVKHKQSLGGESLVRTVSVNHSGVLLYRPSKNNVRFGWKEFFEEFQTIDGKPCGVEITDDTTA
jgi:hypothetical protein